MRWQVRRKQVAGMKRGAREIRIGLGSCGVASGAEPVRDALRRRPSRRALTASSRLSAATACAIASRWWKWSKPRRAVALYGNVTAGDRARQIASSRHVRAGAWAVAEAGRDYLAKQKRIVLENCGEIDPLNHRRLPGARRLSRPGDVPRASHSRNK